VKLNRAAGRPGAGGRESRRRRIVAEKVCASAHGSAPFVVENQAGAGPGANRDATGPPRAASRDGYTPGDRLRGDRNATNPAVEAQSRFTTPVKGFQRPIAMLGRPLPNVTRRSGRRRWPVKHAAGNSSAVRPRPNPAQRPDYGTFGAWARLEPSRDGTVSSRRALGRAQHGSGPYRSIGPGVSTDAMGGQIPGGSFPGASPRRDAPSALGAPSRATRPVNGGESRQPAAARCADPQGAGIRMVFNGLTWYGHRRARAESFPGRPSRKKLERGNPTRCSLLRTCAKALQGPEEPLQRPWPMDARPQIPASTWLMRSRHWDPPVAPAPPSRIESRNSDADGATLTLARDTPSRNGPSQAAFCRDCRPTAFPAEHLPGHARVC